MVGECGGVAVGHTVIVIRNLEDELTTEIFEQLIRVHLLIVTNLGVDGGEHFVTRAAPLLHSLSISRFHHRHELVIADRRQWLLSTVNGSVMIFPCCRMRKVTLARRTERFGHATASINRNVPLYTLSRVSRHHKWCESGAQSRRTTRCDSSRG